MNAQGFVLSLSRLLNKILFGARTSLAEDYNSQLETVAVAYVSNLILIFAVVAITFAAMGIYDPFHSPLAASNIKTPLAVSNTIAFVLTYLASLSWRANEKAIEGRRKASRPTGWFYKLLSAIFIPAIFVGGAFSFILLAGLFHTFSFVNLLGSTFANTIFLHVLFSQRSLKNATRGSDSNEQYRR
jgi:hypothetical protein